MSFPPIAKSRANPYVEGLQDLITVFRWLYDDQHPHQDFFDYLNNWVEYQKIGDAQLAEIFDEDMQAYIKHQVTNEQESYLLEALRAFYNGKIDIAARNTSLVLSANQDIPHNYIFLTWMLGIILWHNVATESYALRILYSCYGVFTQHSYDVYSAINMGWYQEKLYYFRDVYFRTMASNKYAGLKEEAKIFVEPEIVEESADEQIRGISNSQDLPIEIQKADTQPKIHIPSFPDLAETFIYNQTSTTVVLEIVPNIPAGQPATLDIHQEGFLKIPSGEHEILPIHGIPHKIYDLKKNGRILIGSGRYRCVRIQGTSMNQIGIDPDDFVLLKMQPDASHLDIIAGWTQAEGLDYVTIKRYIKQGEIRIFKAESTDPGNKDIEISKGDNCRIFGIAIGILKKL